MINNSNKINENIENARLRAKMITSQAKEMYATEVERLKLFIDRWNNYINDIVNAYPSDKTRKAVAVGQMIKDILMQDTSPEFTDKQKISEIYKLVEEIEVEPKLETKVEPVKEIENTSTNEESGFNLDEVINPKEKLDLDSLLKELGVKK